MSQDAGVTVERQSPEGAFGLLSNGLRVRIIQELGAVRNPLSFSALRERTEERDSGKFNYHLKQLVGHFVTKGEDGYRLSLAGTQMYGAIQSGAYTANASVAPFEFAGPCPSCGNAELVAAYADERASLTCPQCEEWRNEFSFPPASLDQFTREELPVAFDRWMHATVMKVLQGFCSNCGGRIEGHLEPASADSPVPIRALYECERCGTSLSSSPMLPALFDPVTVSFFEDHGVDVLHDPTWTYVDPEIDWEVSIDSEDPLTAEVSIDLAEGRLCATIGADGTTERVSVTEGR